IGQGRCGTVWAVLCSNCTGHHHLAMKREDGSTGRSILHEYQMHRKLLEASLLYDITSFAIPRSFGYLSYQDITAWSGVLPRLPENYTGCNAIVSEKIIPLPSSTRRLIVQNFRPDVDEESVLKSQNNEHCLIRPYLAFSLRNFPLHLDQMEHLGIDPGDYAMAMADALAFLHWVAKVDGNDVEYVLAQPRSQPDAVSNQMQLEGGHSNNADILGPHTMWILDFDLCRDLTLDEKGIEQASNAFWGNDPYYPRPCSVNPANQRLWSIFEERFIQSS
ncbi:uncharacterized protein TRIVIDRAFT_137543, partial [Trichoderma virens Gv29-8]